jgi:hypothetical protein
MRGRSGGRNDATAAAFFLAAFFFAAGFDARLAGRFFAAGLDAFFFFFFIALFLPVRVRLWGIRFRPRKNFGAAGIEKT